MDKEKVIDLTNKVYRQTLLFPKKEPLRYKIREVADDFLAKFISGRSFDKEIEVLKSYFAVAKYQNWVSYFDILEIEKEYDKIYDKTKYNRVSFSSPFSSSVLKQDIKQGNEVRMNATLDLRKRKILKILKEKQKIQVGELQRILPDVSKRTLRRDFEKLLEKGLVQRVGQKNETYYALKNEVRTG